MWNTGQVTSKQCSGVGLDTLCQHNFGLRRTILHNVGIMSILA